MKETKHSYIQKKKAQLNLRISNRARKISTLKMRVQAIVLAISRDLQFRRTRRRSVPVNQILYTEYSKKILFSFIFSFMGGRRQGLMSIYAYKA
jgi:hypothetical protein